MLEAQVQEYHAQVGGAAEYLAQRGINATSVNRFRLGYVTQSDNKSIEGRLAIPYLTPAGPVGLKYRGITDGASEKYIVEPGSEMHLFNPGALLSTDRVVLTEGELDVVAAEQAGVAAVGYPGTSNFRPHYRWCFDSLAEIAIVADGDDPGRKAAKKVAALIGDAVDAAVRIVYLPDGHDTNSFIQQYGELDYAEKVGWI